MFTFEIIHWKLSLYIYSCHFPQIHWHLHQARDVFLAPHEVLHFLHGWKGLCHLHGARLSAIALIVALQRFLATRRPFFTGTWWTGENLLVLNAGNGWQWGNGIIFHSLYGSFPHSRSEAPVRKCHRGQRRTRFLWLWFDFGQAPLMRQYETRVCWCLWPLPLLRSPNGPT